MKEMHFQIKRIEELEQILNKKRWLYQFEEESLQLSWKQKDQLIKKSIKNLHNQKKEAN